MTKTASQSPKISYISIVLFVLTFFVYFFGLNIPLLGPDEPRYAQVAREMFERADWITPTLGGFHWFEKPALLYWLQIAAYYIFGVSEFAARVGSAVFGIGTVCCLWILGRFVSLYPATVNGFTKKNDFANWIAIIAASTIGIVVFSHGASFDIILTFPLTAALVCFYIFDSASNTSSDAALPRLQITASLTLFYIFIGISLIAKGLIGIVFPFAIVAFYYLLSWRFPNKVFIFSLAWGTILAIAVSSAWYLPMYQRNGFEFIDEFFIQHHFQRYTSNKYFHPQPFYFFFWVLPLMTIPWLPFFAAAMWDFIKGIFNRRDTKAPEAATSPLLIFAFAWMCVPLVFFSFSGSKLPGYILPSVPAAVIFTAEYIYRFIQKGRKRVAIIQSIALATFVVITAMALFVMPKFAETDSVKSLIIAADERGFSNAKVLSLHTTSHNAEFYAPGRLLRSEDGKQKRLLGPLDVLQEIERENGKPVLVLVPLEYLKQLTESEALRTEKIKENSELAIVYVSAKK